MAFSIKACLRKSFNEMFTHVAHMLNGQLKSFFWWERENA